MTFCDSSFLLALLLPGDFFHRHALPVAAQFRESIPYTLLAELEVTNTIRRALRERIITRATHDAAFRQIEADLASGILARRDTPQSELFRLARELSRRYTPTIPARSLDILQTASALSLGADTFCSFDERQRQLAKAARLKILPPSMPKPAKAKP
ncbi:MAG: type II toxin-antitoxin system VapC family toxin [Chthoniobacterales bacterium]|nr:type II toxin-antitoxin system VapC family toxin [Chthoniobacterales bacterium]